MRVGCCHRHGKLLAATVTSGRRLHACLLKLMSAELVSVVVRRRSRRQSGCRRLYTKGSIWRPCSSWHGAMKLGLELMWTIRPLYSCLSRLRGSGTLLRTVISARCFKWERKTGLNVASQRSVVWRGIVFCAWFMCLLQRLPGAAGHRASYFGRRGW